MYQVNTEQYAGPLEKLLQLIEEREFQITAISLADVTTDFIEYAKTLESDAHPKIVADFIVVASRLMLIKSKVLIPSLEFTQEEERDVRDLELRLQLYKDFKSASAVFGVAWKNNSTIFSRPFLIGATALFCPPKTLSPASLRYAMNRLIGFLETFIPKEEKTVKRTLVSIEEKMAELLAHFTSGSNQSFNALASGRAKGEVVVLFLAVLHLLKQQKVDISQNSPFTDIIMIRQA